MRVSSSTPSPPREARRSESEVNPEMSAKRPRLARPRKTRRPAALARCVCSHARARTGSGRVAAVSRLEPHFLRLAHRTRLPRLGRQL